MTEDELRNLLLDFADHLNSYKGCEEVRFDFMVVDYIDKNKQAGLNKTLVDNWRTNKKLNTRKGQPL